jgi:hypothetical protein
MVLEMARTLLKKESAPTKETIQKKVKRAIEFTREDENNRPLDVDEDKLARELEELFTFWIGQSTVLENKQDGHTPWLTERKSEISWDFWERYRRYLEVDKGWGPKIVNGLDRLTDDVLERLEGPERSGPWDRRGMVVGQVQSGKTSHYTGLICKAADAGYKLIIVLSGIHKSLRSQTQLRLDEGFLGFDSQVQRASASGNAFMGSGKIPVGKRLIANSATSSADKGDFNTRVAKQFAVSAGGGAPLLFVVKKNGKVLKNLLQWVSTQGTKDGKSGKILVRGVPLLVIDDEADNASINTKEDDITTINSRIRTLLQRFEQSAYIGYTATPFANIFISPTVDAPEEGQDLFPRDFIINLPAPSNYIGPAQLFGLSADSALGLGEEEEGLPIVRTVVDAEDWMPTRHKKDHIPTELPRSLRKAMKAFVLSSAVRIIRGQQNKHNSMLIHVTRFTDVQAQVAQQVKDELTFLNRCLWHGDDNERFQLMAEFRALWETDFLKTTQSIIETKVKTKTIEAPNVQPVSWEQVQPLLPKTTSRIKVKTINGTAKDVLEYQDYENKGQGLNVIAIGGDKLSRGLTLEGLTVSYYLRASRMYDTLMQMGRWFGYKPGYLDICRLYTTDELVEWYEHITVASEELRQEFDYMADSGATPEEFGLKVRTHPQGMIITAVNKMRTGTNMQLSYTKSLSETTIFDKDDKKNQKNLQVTEELLMSLGQHSKLENNNHIWTRVVADKIANFLSGYKSHQECRLADTSILIEYIDSRQSAGELVSWTVVLISNKRAANKYEIAGKKIGLTKRTNVSKLPEQYRLSKSHLLSPLDEWLDLPIETREDIRQETNDERIRQGKQAGNTPSGPILRSKRSPKNGLLLLYPLDPQEINSKVPVIGFVISFPQSRTDKLIPYRVNKIYLEQEFGEL